ncbi:hypothetical protein [Acaryochloris sp. CCMEE 5410]|uniref:hypothetical protein n=1 Tax=Acaryochloris sp. CCMEE 5410 TaxID=310037 RepID=UPI0002DB1E9B|nr:hypothetical protein [Acaryochloris sp. CCMEE 5410]KAI9131957.1 hypothetical protein ON05_024130 [Acaryochloris sp. CCMEE 5410]
MSTQISALKVDTTEISLPSSITLQQFLSSHYYNSQNTTIPTWLQFLQDFNPFKINGEGSLRCPGYT